MEGWLKKSEKVKFFWKYKYIQNNKHLFQWSLKIKEILTKYIFSIIFGNSFENSNTFKIININFSGHWKLKKYWQNIYSQWFLGILYNNFITTGFNIRLMNGTTKYSGRVEVNLGDGQGWGTVCHDSWDKDDARVVCQSMGFPTG